LHVDRGGQSGLHNKIVGGRSFSSHPPEKKEKRKDMTFPSV
jgi:hypothetical protein